MGIRRKKQKYISLKEAAKISGYAPDYIGYLIRKGKIPGKRVYSGVACLTTEEAIKEYQEKIKNQKSKIKNRERSIKLIYDIFPPEKIKEAAKEITGFKPYRTKTAKFFAISWRLALVTGLIFLLIVINPIEVFQKLIGVFTEKEKTINLYSTLCMGNWQNPQNAQGQPEVLPSGDFNSFSETNSAVYKGGPLILFCQNFAPNSEIETTSPALIEQQEEGKPTSFFEKIKRFFGNLTAKAQQIPTFEEINKTKFLSAKIKFSFAINEKITEFTPILEEPSPEIPSTIESVSPPQEGIEEELGEIESEIEFTPELLHPIETTTPPISFWNKVKNFFGTLIVKAKTILSRIIPDIFVRAEEEISIIETVTPPQEAIIPEAGPEICAIDTTTPPTEAISPPPIEAEPLPIEEEQEELPQDILPNLDTKIIIWYSLDGELWWRLDTISSYPLSNALNDGYFSYDAPFLENWEDVRNLKIKFEGVIGRETKILAYLDSVWLEINYQEQKEKSEEPKKIFKMKIKDNSLIFPQLQKDFLINEEPIFIITEPELTVEELIATEKVEVIEEILQLQEPEESFFEKIKEKTGSLKEKILGPIIEKILPDEVKAQENKIKAQIFRPEGKKLDILPEINSFLKNGKEAFEVKIPKPKRGLKPGLYKLEIEFETAEAIFIVEQDFSWGVLAINTNKSIYLSGEKTYIQMAVLDNLGHTICDALLKLQIKSPRSQITTFSTEDGTIKKSPECGPKSVTYTPDYYTYYDIPDEIGVYEMHLIAESNRQKGARDTYDSFEVRRSVPFNIERMGPTRIYPKASYEMKMKIKANRSFKGGVIERIPDSFVIIEKNEKREEKREEEKLIIWGVDWKAGKTYELSYQFKTPNISPYLYLLGPLQIGKFQEIKQWQIVADAPDTWVQTTQADFDAGVLNQVDTSTNPGDVILDERDCWGSGGSCNASCQYSTRTGHTDLYSGDGACSATASCPNATYYTFSGTCSGTGSGSCYIQGSTTTRYTSCTQGSGCAGSCGGSCGPCSFFGSESECTFCGCSWTPSCTGSCSCPGKSESVCNNCNGCMWLSGDCQGECTCSGTSPAYCTSCGCTASGSCGGSCGCVGKAQDLCIGCMCNWNWTQWNWDASGAQTKRTAGTQCSWYDYYASGTIASQVHDSGKAGTFWGELSWNETLQASTDITFEVRASDTSFLKGDATPSWTGVGGNSPVVSGLPSGRYQQWRATLTTTNYGNTPTLHDVTITYTLATNISGTAQQYDQSTNAPDSETVKVAINGLAQTQTGSTSTGSWSIDIPSSSITSGDVVTIWIDAVADANEAVAVTKYDGTGDITGINLYERHLSIGSDDNQTITNSNLNQYDNSVSSDEDIFHEVDINNDLTVPASGTSTYTDQELIIKANNTHRPDSASSGNVTTPNLEINGTLTADGNTINLTAGGTPFVINGTFTASSSTFQYTANADTNITATTYYNLELIDPPKESPRLPTGQAPKQVTSNKRQATRDKFQTQNSNNQTVFGKIYQGFKENLLRFFDSLKKLLKIIAGYFKNISNIFAKSPKIIYALVEPDKVRPGDIMAVTAEIEDDYGIKEVRADMGEIEIIDLKLKEGNLYQGIWEAKWLVHDVEPREYITTITAINQKGKKSKVTLKWSDPIWDSTDLETRTISCDATVVGTNVQTDTTYSNIDLDFDPATVTISEIRCKVNFTSVNDGASNWTEDSGYGEPWLSCDWNAQFMGRQENISSTGEKTISTTSSTVIDTTTQTGNTLVTHLYCGDSEDACNPQGDTLEYQDVRVEISYVSNPPTITNSTGTSNITSSSARLNGEVTDTGGEDPTVHIYWGDNDGVTTSGNWDHDENMGTQSGTFYEDISGLSPNTTYYYRCYATNSGGSDWADSTEQFTTSPATYTLATGAFHIQGYLLIGNGTDTFTVTAATNNPTLDVDGNFTIDSNATFTASATASFTVGGNWSNSGTFNHSDGTVTFDDSGQTSQLTYSAATTFYNFTVSTAGKTLQFDETDQINISGTLTLQGSDCTTGRIFLDSTTNDDQWNINATGSTDIDYVDVEDSNAIVALTAENSTEDNNNNTNWSIDIGVCTTPTIIPGGGGAPIPPFSATCKGNVLESLGGEVRCTFESGEIAKVVFPPSAIKGTAVMKIEPQDKNEVIKTNPLPKNNKIIGDLVANFKALSGEKELEFFEKEVPITLTYSDSQVKEAKVKEKTLEIYFWDESKGAWQSLPSSEVNTTANTVTAPTFHFALFGVMGRKPIIEVPEIIKKIPEKIKETIKEISEEVSEIGRKIARLIKPKPLPPPLPPAPPPIPEVVPLVFQGKWQLLPSKPIYEFVLAPLPGAVRTLVKKFPQLEKVFSQVGIAKITDIRKLEGVKLTLPGLTERVGLILPIGIPVAKLPPEAKEKIPTDTIFCKTGGGKIDLNIALTITKKGKPEQRIRTISGKPLNCIVKPDRPVKSIKGYVVFRAKKTSSSSFRFPLASLIDSLFFAKPVFAFPRRKPVEIEERLVLIEFEYTDPDEDGIYTAEIQAPISGGEYEIITVMDYEDLAFGLKEIRLITAVDPEGYIFEKYRGKELRIPGATISLFWLNPEKGEYELWPAEEFLQENPQITDITGKYSFLVPAGSYYLRVEAPGYLTYQGEPFQVKEGSGIHLNIELKTKYWWLRIVDWKIVALILIIILLLYNFYRDKIREKLMRKKYE